MSFLSPHGWVYQPALAYEHFRNVTYDLSGETGDSCRSRTGAPCGCDSLTWSAKFIRLEVARHLPFQKAVMCRLISESDAVTHSFYDVLFIVMVRQLVPGTLG